VKTEFDMMTKKNYIIEAYTQILHLISLQCRRIFEFLLIIKHVHFLGKGGNSKFTEADFSKNFSNRILERTVNCKSEQSPGE
jgi:hypothetical protein